jgi:hypothetical protein
MLVPVSFACFAQVSLLHDNKALRHHEQQEQQRFDVALDIFLLIRIVRVVPVLKLLHSTWKASDSMDSTTPIVVIDIILMVYTVTVILHFFPCLLYRIAVWEGLPHSWMGRYSLGSCLGGVASAGTASEAA